MRPVRGRRYLRRLKVSVMLAVVLSAVAGLTAFAVAYQVTRATTVDFAGITGDPNRGEYVLRVAGCTACHTDPDDSGAPLAGGRRLETPFGTFVTSNITPDDSTGIGTWSLEDFATALMSGVSPEGKHYYPSFPYTSYTLMTRQDTADLKAHLDRVPPVRNAVPDHELRFPFSIRHTLVFWKALFFTPGTYVADPAKPNDWNRGGYLVNGPAHCVQCHTDRNLLGGFEQEHLAGTRSGPEGDPVPSISPHVHGGIQGWTVEDIVFALQVGMKPDGDSVGSVMGEVVDESTSRMRDMDLVAIAKYLLDAPQEAP